MKKIIFLALVLTFGFKGTSIAQIQEGNFMVGSDIGSGLVSSTTSDGIVGFNFGLNEGAGFNLGINPKVGYFFNDNFLLGAVVNLGYSKSAEQDGESAKVFSYGVQALSRYYLVPGEDVQNVLDSGRFFLEGNAGLAGVNVQDGDTTNGFAFGVGPGYSYFINSNVALEATVKYNGLVGGGNTTYQNAMGINLGIQVFLPSSEAENMIENAEDQL